MTAALKDLTLKAAHHWVGNLILRIEASFSVVRENVRTCCSVLLQMTPLAQQVYVPVGPAV